MSSRKKGFTLVELLIVIVVIGVLSAMMMLSSTEAVSSAKAANIINNLRNWKTATLEWYADNLDKVSANGQILNDDGTIKGNFAENVKPSEIAKYFNGSFTTDFQVTTGLGKYHVKDNGSGVEYWTDHINDGNKFIWFIGCQFADNDTSLSNKSLIEKLVARANSVGLVYKDSALSKYTGNKGNNHRVWIMVNDFRNN